MKKHLSTIILIAIFFIGLSVLLYPTLANYVNSKHQSRAIAQYVEAMSHVDPEQYDAELAEARAYNEAIRSKPARFSPSEEELEAFHHMLGADNTAIGYIEIPCIRVDLPLYLGTEESVLQVGVGVMPGSSLPIGGESTHTVLTGHRGLPSSRLFTALDGINTHRMLVRGHRVENAVADTVAARVTADAIQVDTLLVTPIVAAPMLLILLVALMLQGRKKNRGGKRAQ